jgi:proteasome activator subunit 4
VLKYKEKLVSLLKLLHQKTYSKRGWTWTGRLLSSTLLTLTHTYPTENRFVNPEEWNSTGSYHIVRAIAPSAHLCCDTEFQKNHHRYWGKLYKPEDVKVCGSISNHTNLFLSSSQISWHVPNDEEIELALRIFREVVEPAMDALDGLLQDGTLHVNF